jgi:hypothetical protein
MAEAVAAILVKRKRMIEKLRKVGALSCETAASAEKADIYEGYILKDLIKQGKVKKTEDNRYYVCEDEK